MTWLHSQCNDDCSKSVCREVWMSGQSVVIRHSWDGQDLSWFPPTRSWWPRWLDRSIKGNLNINQILVNHDWSRLWCFEDLPIVCLVQYFTDLVVDALMLGTYRRVGRKRCVWSVDEGDDWICDAVIDENSRMFECYTLVYCGCEFVIYRGMYTQRSIKWILVTMCWWSSS